MISVKSMLVLALIDSLVERDNGLFFSVFFLHFLLFRIMCVSYLTTICEDMYFELGICKSWR